MTMRVASLNRSDLRPVLGTSHSTSSAMWSRAQKATLTGVQPQDYAPAGNGWFSRGGKEKLA